MRIAVSLGLFLCSCSLLPHDQILCTDTGLCDPNVPIPFVLGKPDARGNPYTLPINGPVGVALTPDGKLIVADAADSVLRVWLTVPTQSYQPIDFALGKANASLPTLTMGQYAPKAQQLFTDGNQLVVMGSQPSGGWNTGDQLYYWQPVPTQHTLYTAMWSLASGPDMARSVYQASPLIVGSRFYLSDSGDSRLLTWNAFPTTPTDANGVIGQPSFNVTSPNSGNTAPTNITFSRPNGSPASDGQKLVVPDSANNRVLIFPSLPVDNTVVAQGVLGQSSFSANSPNRTYSGPPMPNASTLNNPQAVALSGTHLAVADSGNNRVLLWNNTWNGMGIAADVVLGQPAPSTITANSGGVSAASMSNPLGVATDGTRLVVSDNGNHRVLIWNSWPTQSSIPADIILGQPAQDLNALGGIYADTNSFLNPMALAGGNGAFYVVDTGANRLLVYDQAPTSPTDRPHFVLGQPDFTTSAASASGPAANNFAGPLGASTDGNALAVADTYNHRILLFNSPPAKNQQPADVVLGQADFTTNLVDAGGMPNGLSSPHGVFLGGGKLYVADTGNNRILIWNKLPTQNQLPDIYLGQPDSVSFRANQGQAVPTAVTMSSPTAVVADATSIYVCDTGNARVLVWKTLTPTTGQAADLVIGQPTFNAFAPSTMPVANAFNSPVGLSVVNNHLYVADSAENRIVYFDVTQLSPNVSAQGVYGQSDLNSGSPNPGGIAANTFFTPTGVLALVGGLYVADSGNGRVVALPPPPGSSPAS